MLDLLTRPADTDTPDQPTRVPKLFVPDAPAPRRPRFDAIARANPITGWNALGKRALDLFVAAVALLIMAPPMLLIAAVIRWESPGPALFRQTRTGLGGRPFRVLKFRTMRADACQSGACTQSRRGDPRVTRVGAWLRRSSLDELPQLFNVLRGDMSIVGPRPHAAGSRAGDRLFEDVARHYAARHRVRPGMTGLAQIRGLRGETDTEEKLIRRVEADLAYIETFSLRLDIRIIWETLRALPRLPNAH
jgi:lipopolysaccharide/colanic/teichoic acid biosynthesis glycosyltransferase